MIFLCNSQAYACTLVYTNDDNLTLYSNRQRFSNANGVIFMPGNEYNLLS